MHCLIGLIAAWLALAGVPAKDVPRVPILVYHRLGPGRTDSMTVTTEHFRQHLELLGKQGFTVIPLADFVNWRLGRGPQPPPRAVVITFDDGHKSVFQYARALIQAYRAPVTLFIYPSCISRASYCLTWEQLSELEANPLFTIESHTTWHPNFKTEARVRSPESYQQFAESQLRGSRLVLEQRMKRDVKWLAWPFGIYDSYLMDLAKQTGYEAAFSIDCRAATFSDPQFSIPRCLVSDDYSGARFLQFLDAAIRKGSQ
jgi:peptidoglycan/xylan/chitin deacetylase (PgdA/CDA1 family)